MKYLIFSLLLMSLSTFAKDIKVLIVDTGMDPYHLMISPYLDKKDVDKHPENYRDFNGHGTHIAGIIVKGVCLNVKVYSCDYYDDNKERASWNTYFSCLKRAKDEHMYIINFSSDGDDPFTEEYNVLKDVLNDKNITMVVAAGNRHKNLGNPCWGTFPGCYKFDNMVLVGSMDENQKIAITSNYGTSGMSWRVGEYVYSSLPNNHMGYMSGTSMAAAAYTNYLLREKCKEINK